MAYLKSVLKLKNSRESYVELEPYPFVINFISLVFQTLSKVIF